MSISKTVEHYSDPSLTPTYAPDTVAFGTDPNSLVRLHVENMGPPAPTETAKVKRQNQQAFFEAPTWTMTLPPTNPTNSALTTSATITLALQTEPFRTGIGPDILETCMKSLSSTLPEHATKVKRQTLITGNPGPPPPHNRISTGGIAGLAIGGVVAVVGFFVCVLVCVC